MSENLIVIKQEQYDALMTEVRELKSLIVAKNKDEADSQWIESEEARKILGVCSKTWQNWRDARKLPFTQFGRKIWVKRADINAFLESNYKQAL